MVPNIRRKYREMTGSFISTRTIRQYLQDLADIGFVEKATHPEDRRRNVYYLIEGKLGNHAFQLGALVAKRFSENKLREWLEIFTPQMRFTITQIWHLCPICGSRLRKGKGRSRERINKALASLGGGRK